jgi:hypothetical protein
MEASKAISILRVQLEEADAAVDGSLDIDAWRTKTLTALRMTLGDHELVSHFSVIRFSPMAVALGGDLDRQYAASRQRGVREAVGVLEAAIFELENSDADSDPSATPSPALSLTAMHPWIRAASAKLWADGHHRQAVKEAASEMFDKQLPAKVQLPRGTPLDQMVNRAFGNIATPFLKIPGVPATGPDRTNAYEGAQHLGLSCISLVRNLRTHNFPGTEEEFLEELAMLSRFARIVDSSTL